MNQFGWTNGGLHSGFLCWSRSQLTPALSSRLLPAPEKWTRRKKAQPHGHHDTWVGKDLWFAHIEWSLHQRWAIVLLCVPDLRLYPSWCTATIGRDWMPQEDQNELSVWIETA